MDLYQALEERGFIQDCTNADAVRAMLLDGPVTMYIGFDPTAPSLHAGSLVQLMALAHAQRAGHRVIALVGGGTAMVGDPSGRTELRQMLGSSELEHNKRAIAAQIGRFVDLRGDGGLQGDGGLLVDNADWLLSLNYIQFLREVGRHFSVNRMLAAEAYRIRLEKGLSFLEFNYQVLQAYDFRELYSRFGCRLQMGGSDQWGNIVAGVDLVRRMEAVEVHGLTTPLVMTSSGEKMGKTAAGAVWLDQERLSPYDYFQYWRNVPDADVQRFLLLFTFLPRQEILDLTTEGGAALNRAKETLAWEATCILHGREAADHAKEGARAAFGGGAAAESVPSHGVSLPVSVVEALVDSGLCSSRSDARRQIRGGAVKVGDRKVASEHEALDRGDLEQDGTAMLWRGRKNVVRLVVE